METRTAFKALFVGTGDVDVSIVESSDKFYLQIKQGEHMVWIPLADAKEFAAKLNLWAIDNG